MGRETLASAVCVLVIGYIACCSAICPSDVPAAITAILEACSDCQREYWGIRVDQLEANGTWTTLFTRNEMSFFLPASNNKLYTTSAAFFEFGIDWTITTPVYLSAEGDVCVVGQGDPSISEDDIMQLAAVLRKDGLSSVRDVIVDNTFYPEPTLPQSWEWSDILSPYAGQPTPAMLDENTYTFFLFPGEVGEPLTYNFSNPIDASLTQIFIEATTTEASVPANVYVDVQPSNVSQLYIYGTLPYGSGAFPFSLAAINPGRRFALALAAALQESQITVSGNMYSSNCSVDQGGWKQIASITSPTLFDMMNYTLQTSDNIYAENFLMHLGKTITNNTATSRELGMSKVHQMLTEQYGVTNKSFVQDDGSGISRHNFASPQSLIEVLRSVFAHEDASAYLSFLPVAGKSGTLIDRYINTTAQGILHAKTGTLDGVNCLSGYIDHQDSEHPVLIFSMLVNYGTQPSAPHIDDIGVMLSTVTNC